MRHSTVGLLFIQTSPQKDGVPFQAIQLVPVPHSLCQFENRWGFSFMRKRILTTPVSGLSTLYMDGFWQTLSDRLLKYSSYGEDSVCQIVMETLHMMTITQNGTTTLGTFFSSLVLLYTVSNRNFTQCDVFHRILEGNNVKVAVGKSKYFGAFWRFLRILGDLRSIHYKTLIKF